MKNQIKIRGQVFPVASLEEASSIYARERDESGEGASTFSSVTFKFNGIEHRVTYNGRVWKRSRNKNSGVSEWNVLACDAVAPAAGLIRISIIPGQTFQGAKYFLATKFDVSDDYAHHLIATGVAELVK